MQTLFQISITLLFVLFPYLIYGQSTHAYIQKIGLKDGLPSMDIRQVLEDSRGFIWITTGDYGLCRYDGVRIKNYTKEEHGLNSNFLSSIVEDKNGMLWITGGQIGETLKDINIFNPVQETCQSIKSYLGEQLTIDSFHCTELSQQANGNILFEQADTISYAWDGQQLTRWNSPSGLQKNGLIWHNTHVNGHIEIWATNSEGNTIETIQSPFYEEMEVSVVRPLQVLSNNTFLGMYRHKNGKWRLFKKPLKQPLTTIHQIPSTINTHFAFHQGHYYLFEKSHVNIYNEAYEHLYQLPITIKGVPFWGKKGDFWYKTPTELVHVAPFQSPFNYFSVFRNNIRLANRGVATTKNNGLYFCSGAEISYNENSQQEKTKLPYYYYYGLLLDGHKDFWVTASREGLFHYSTKTKTYHLYPPKPIPNPNRPFIFWTPYKDKHGQIWIGSTKGLWQLHQQDSVLKRWSSPTFDTLNRSSVYHFHENKAGLWLCTSTGLYLMDKNNQVTHRYYEQAPEQTSYLPHNIIMHLHEDKDGSFWLATKGGGLIHWNPATSTYNQYTTQQGLSHNIIYAVYEDDFGFLWLPSHRGLMQFDKNKHTPRIFLKENGLLNNEFNTISHHQADNGWLYFGSITGLISFNPQKFKQKPSTIPFKITNYYKQDATTDSIENYTNQLLENHKIVLNPDDKAFTLHFALLDYNNTSNNQYAYKIEGYDKIWNYTPTASIEKNRLPYGNYTLLLKARGSDSYWQEYPTPIEIQVLRPFYLQWWFIVLEVLFSFSIIYGVFRWRIQRLQNRKKELEYIVQQRTEKIEQQANDLKALDKVKSRFFANISHELRTPLTLILGPLSSIIDHPKQLDNPHTIHKLTTMQRNGKSLLNLIEEILDLSKLDAQKLELKEVPTLFKTYIFRIFSAFESQAQYQNIGYKLEYDLPTDLGLLIDQNKTEKIINNLLSNALKFTPATGQIVLKVCLKDNNIVVQVKDTGKGIHPEDLAHIFDRFYQARKENQVAEGGTGIGLALSKELAELMEGSLSATSTVGEGSSFSFSMPKKIVTMATPKETIEPIIETTIDPVITQPSFNGKTFTILLVEDNHDMRNFVGSLLLPQYNLLTASNGKEGLQLLQKNTAEIDLIISDVMMPEMDGFEFLEQVKSNPTWRNIPMMMLTARANEKDKLQALTVGVNDYLTKPFSVPELLARVRNLLENYAQRLLWQAEENLAQNAPALDTVLEDSNTATPVLPAKAPAKTEVLPTISEADQAWVQEIEKFVKSNIDREYDNSILAKEFTISERQLTRRLKKVTGLTPAKFVKEIRLQMARDYLEKGSFISATEVAYAVGLSSLQSFSKMYIKRFGKRPSDYYK